MTTFGEIAEPGTRTAWEDWDDAAVEHSNPQVKWQHDLEEVQDINTLFIFEGKYLTDCVKVHNLHKLEFVNTVPDVNLMLLKSKSENKYICTIKDYNMLLSSEIVDLLKPYLMVSQDVIALQTKPLHEYQSLESTSKDCIIRMVCTTNPPSKSFDYVFPKLEQPNIISGVSAGAITLREYLDSTGAAIVCYMEHPEEYQMDELEKLLQKLDISQASTLRPSSILNSNLYI